MLITVFLSLGIFFVSILWLLTDPRPIRSRLNMKIISLCFLLYIIIIPQIISHYYFPIPHSQWDILIVGTGLLLFTIGVALDVWARLTMKKYWGPPGQHDLRRQTKLITQGLFAISRNPIYIGTTLLLFGFALALRSVFFFLPIFLLLYFYRQIIIEEKLLVKHFGEEYVNYRKKVPRFFKT